jgi:hypothetical protein
LPWRFESVPLWGLRVFFGYMMRWVDCPRCGFTVEQGSWADGKHSPTHDDVRVVSRPMGEAPELERRRTGLSHQLGPSVRSVGIAWISLD